MVDVDYLSRLVALLKESNVSSYKTASLELNFWGKNVPLAPEVGANPGSSSPPVSQFVDVPENNLPPDLRTDQVNDFDKILHWSGSPGVESETETPGADDLPLTLAP